MNTKKLQITFIHETGHHIANELNYRVFKFNRKTESIFLYPSNSGDFFDGQIKVANNNAEHYHPENTSLEYIRIFYGCLFECLYREIEISKCLCEVAKPSDIKECLCKGRVDYHDMAHITMSRNIKNRFDWWRYLTVEYFSLMKNNLDLFQTVFELKVQDFILKQNNDYVEINLDQLNIALEPFLIDHKKDFEMAVENLKKLNI
ncbi:hypothetical protein [Maribacter sp. 2308TA10-17]|uniref:hypothetical protein n=1 Tax=Maribacter sp. 2308TA10-17 TaxID=3386276 RepID=UPI0039BD5C30